MSAWEGFDVVDILLAAIGLGAAGLGAARAAGVRVGLPGGSGAATALAGFAAAVIALTFLLEGDERKIGMGLPWWRRSGSPTGAGSRPGSGPPQRRRPAPPGGPPPAAG